MIKIFIDYVWKYGEHYFIKFCSNTKLPKIVQTKADIVGWNKNSIIGVIKNA